jgi:ABC-2 type transport system permease protein
MIAVELRKLVRSRRTWVTIVLLDALPSLVAVLLATTDLGPRPGTGPPFLAAVLTNGRLYPLAAIGVILPLFLPTAVAVVAGESIAGEAQAGTLRYVLIRPVGRTRVLVAKLISAIAFVVIAVAVVAATAYVLGRALLGSESMTSVTSVSGTSLSSSQLLWRTGLSLAYAILSMLGVAAIAVFLSTLVESPLAAAMGTMAMLIASTLLLTLDAAQSLYPYLPTRYWLSFVDLFRDPILWRNVERGTALQAVYVAVFLAAGWANFMTKDIKS